MDKFVITGGRRLQGRVQIHGAKNAVLPELTAALLAEKGETVLTNVPDLSDITFMLTMLETFGAKVTHDKETRTVVIDASSLTSYEAPYELVRKMRASFLVLGPLLARLGKAKVSLPGGCVLGARPVNLHIKGFRRMGASVVEEHGYVYAECNRLRGETIFFDRPSHTGTENIMMGAVLAQGETIILNAAADPEVVDLANMLTKMGAYIEGAGGPVIRIRGVSKLHGCSHHPIGDRLDAGTYLHAGAMTGGDVTVAGVPPEDLSTVLVKLSEAGCEITSGPDGIRLQAPERPRAVEIITYPFPGYPTDLQACAVTLATISEGSSHIRETVFENRFSHAMEMQRLGAQIKIAVDEATIDGVDHLSGAQVMASDIRGGAGLVLAGLAASGTTEVLRVYHIDRGYEGMDIVLNELGAEIVRMEQ